MSTHDITARLRALALEFPAINRIMDCEWTNAADEIKRLRAERDEARREVCDFCESGDEWNTPEVARQIAAERGWDCYKEATDER